MEHAELEKWHTLSQEPLQPRHPDGPVISKNKKRKLKKKQQMKRKKAAGLLTKASGISFLYEPREDGCGQSDSDASEGDGGPGPEAGDLEDAGDTEAEEAGTGIREKADGILDFLKSTQEMYLYDGMICPVFLLNRIMYLFGNRNKYSIIFKCLKYKTLNIHYSIGTISFEARMRVFSFLSPGSDRH